MEESSSHSIPDNVREMIRAIKNVTEKHSDDDIHKMLLECNMDFNETAERLLYLGSFEEVTSKRDRKKGRDGGSRSAGQTAMRGRGNFSRSPRGGRSTTTRPQKEIRLGNFINKGPEISPVKTPVNPSRNNRNNNNAASGSGSGASGSGSGSRNASIWQVVDKNEAQKSAEVASENSTEMIVEVTPESVNEPTVSALDLQMEKINFSALRHVIFPNRIRVLDPFKGGLSFGSMDIEYEKRFARELETRVVHAATPENEDTAKETFVSNRGVSLTPEEGEILVHPESPRHVPETSSLQEDEICVHPESPRHVPETSSLQEGEILVHPESPRHVPETSSLQEGVSVNEAMEYHQQIPIQPTLGGEPLQSEGPESQNGSSSDASQPPPPSYEQQTEIMTYVFPDAALSSSNQHEGQTTVPQGFQGYYPNYHSQQLYYHPQMGYYNPAMQQALPQMGYSGYYYPAMQADPNAYYGHPAMMQQQADPNLYYGHPAMPQADPNLYYGHPAMQQQQQADPNLYYGHHAMQQQQQQAPTQAVDHNASYRRPPRQQTLIYHQPAMRTPRTGSGSPYRGRGRGR